MSHKIITNLFRFATGQGAQGLTIESRPSHLALDYHFPGGDRQSFTLPKKLEKELLDDLHRLLKIAPGELTAKKYCKLSDGRQSSAFHVTILPGEFGEKIIISQVPKNCRAWRLKQLGCPPFVLKNLQAAIKKRAGLILLSGPSLSGRNATLHALLRDLDREKKTVYLLGDEPIKNIPGLNTLTPTPANQEWLLRHDSEIIALESIDQAEDLRFAFTGANTGRLIIGVMNADSSWEVLNDILALPLPLKLKLDSLKIITNQRLAKMKRAQNGRQKNERREIALFEMFRLTPAIKQFLLKNEKTILALSLKKDTKTIKKFWEELAILARESGFMPLALDQQAKVKAGILAKDNQ